MKNLKLAFATLLMTSLCCCKVSQVSIPENDDSPPNIVSARLAVLGPGGYGFDLNEFQGRDIGRINVDNAMSLTFNAQDLESGIRSINVRGIMSFNCGPIDNPRAWEFSLNNPGETREIGESVRIAAGVNKSFTIKNIYDEANCNYVSWERYPVITSCTFEVTVINHKGQSTFDVYTFSIIPSQTGVTILDI